jgi:hypothetical protein
MIFKKLPRLASGFAALAAQVGLFLEHPRVLCGFLS